MKINFCDIIRINLNQLTFIIVFLVISLIDKSICIKEWWESTKAVELNSAKFQETVGKTKFVVVKFYTKWCKYCKILAPIYDEFVDYISLKEKNDTLVIARLEANSNQEIVMMYGIYSFPTVVIFGPNSSRPLSVYEGDRKIEGLWFWVFKHLPQLKRSQRTAKALPAQTNSKPVTVNSVNNKPTNQGARIVNIDLKKAKTDVIKIERDHIDAEAFNDTLVDIRGGNFTNTKESNELQNVRNSTEIKKMTSEINEKLELMEKSVVLLEKQLFDLKSDLSGQREIEKEKQKRILLVLIVLVILIIGICFKCIFSNIRKPKQTHYN